MDAIKAWYLWSKIKNWERENESTPLINPRTFQIYSELH